MIPHPFLSFFISNLKKKKEKKKVGFLSLGCLLLRSQQLMGQLSLNTSLSSKLQPTNWWFFFTSICISFPCSVFYSASAFPFQEMTSLRRTLAFSVFNKTSFPAQFSPLSCRLSVAVWIRPKCHCNLTYIHTRSKSTRFF